MKAVELLVGQKSSRFPIKKFSELNIHDEYFLVGKGIQNVSILRYIEDIKAWYIISLDSFCTHKLELDIEELNERFHVYCIPEYTGGSAGIESNVMESREARKELLEFIVNRFM